MKHRSQAGNALFLILIAVALFAALAYAVTQSSRTGSGSSISSEQATLYAAQITQMGAMFKQDVTRLILSGKAASTIVIGTGAWFTGQANDFCTSGVNCLFAAAGGGVSVPKAPAGAMTDGVFRNIYFDTHSSSLGSPLTPYYNVASSANDEAIKLEPIRKDVCLAINKGLGINTIPYWVTGASWVGIASAESACVDWGGSGAANGNYTFYQVIIAN